jgi:hypothetical protein
MNNSTKNQKWSRHCGKNQIEKWKNMYMWFFKKMSSMFFPYVLHDVLFVWTKLCFICPKFHYYINNILCECISLFCLGYRGPLHARTILKLYSLTLSFAQNSLTYSNELTYCNKTLGRTWDNHLANNISNFISSRLWPALIPYQPLLMLSTISTIVSYFFEFITTSSIAPC